jgi:hypothetical protein
MDRVEQTELPPETQTPGAKGRRKGLLYFRGVAKPLLMNDINPRTIAGMYGNDTRTWPGKPVTLFASTTMFKGQMVDCIRVRPLIPAMPEEPGRAPKKPAGKKPKQLPPHKPKPEAQDAEYEEVRHAQGR